jgi:hypothetical protein
MMISCSSPSKETGVTGSKRVFEFDQNKTSRWISFENPNGLKGAGGHENRGAKGHPWEPIMPGESKVLMDIEGIGIIHRMWITVNNRSPEMLRGMRIDMYWDGAEKPAVSAPFGDFFGVGLGKTAVFENELFSNPEGRSFNSYVQMPFKSGAKIVVTNETGIRQPNIFYDINYSLLNHWEEDFLYFHAYWHRDTATTAGVDFEILPKVSGKGRFLGTNIGVNTNPAYEQMWWGEGEVKLYLDGDDSLATLVGTGTEDYIGSAWSQGEYANLYQGCPIANKETEEWAFYRYHIKDPVFFREDFKATIQVMGGGMKDKVLSILNQEDGPPLIPVSIGWDRQLNLLEENITDYEGAMDGWMNFYRSDDYSAVAYFYLDRPTSSLPGLQELKVRTTQLKPIN